MSKKVVNLIVIDQNNNISLSQEAKDFLLSIPENQILGVLSILGKKKTGKSYLLNKGIINENVFEIKNSIQPCTKGLMLLKELQNAENNKYSNLKYLVIDSEGLNNSKIFILNLLISSFVVYNSCTAIDEQSIQDLQVFIQISQKIENSLSQNPNFLWIIRDFALYFLIKQTIEKLRQLTNGQQTIFGIIFVRIKRYR